MDEPLLLALPVLAGCIVQGAILLNGEYKKNFWKILGVLFVAVLGLIPGKSEFHYDLPMHVFTMAFMFCLGYAVFLKEYLMAKISETSVLVLNIIILYLLTARAGEPGRVLLPYAALFSIYVLFVNLVNRKESSVSKVMLYVWHMVMNVIFLIYLIYLAAFSAESGTLKILDSPIGNFFAGMIMLYLIGNIFYIMFLIPIPGKHQSFSDKIEDIKEHIHMMLAKFDDRQTHPVAALGFAAVFSMLLFANYRFEFVAESIIINAAFIMSMRM